ncbi:hypothetical protein OEA41_007499 [Lepraria neglecta]|uniref:Uncharacterized protein n=1 Tax=Lepraria neglecta TaxID=209136 RepID=A0AAD9ZCT6_9LECA|nr:hypothetical protein OEA41_007499 [Lepraria neglecta]
MIPTLTLRARGQADQPSIIRVIRIPADGSDIHTTIVPTTSSGNSFTMGMLGHVPDFNAILGGTRTRNYIVVGRNGVNAPNGEFNGRWLMCRCVTPKNGSTPDLPCNKYFLKRHSWNHVYGDAFVFKLKGHELNSFGWADYADIPRGYLGSGWDTMLFYVLAESAFAMELGQRLNAVKLDSEGMALRLRTRRAIGNR